MQPRDLKKSSAAHDSLNVDLHLSKKQCYKLFLEKILTGVLDYVIQCAVLHRCRRGLLVVL